LAIFYFCSKICCAEHQACHPERSKGSRQYTKTDPSSKKRSQDDNCCCTSSKMAK